MSLPHYPLSNVGCNDSAKVNANNAYLSDAIAAIPPTPAADVTLNVLAKGLSATHLQDSSITDDGTDVRVVGEQIKQITNTTGDKCLRVINTNASGYSGIVFGQTDNDSDTPGALIARTGSVYIGSMAASALSIQNRVGDRIELVLGSGSAKFTLFETVLVLALATLQMSGDIVASGTVTSRANFTSQILSANLTVPADSTMIVGYLDITAGVELEVTGELIAL